MKIKNYLNLLVVSLLLTTACKNESTKINSTEEINHKKTDKTEEKNEKEWVIFDEEVDKAFNKTNIYVRLEKAIDEQRLSEIANEIRKLNNKYEKVYIFYLLPDQVKGKGAWAYSHYTPKLELKIQGTTIEEENQLKSSKVTGEILSKWEDTQPYVGNVKYLVKENGSLIMKIIYKDGSKKNEELSKSKYKSQTRYNYENKHGEFYVIEANGNLGYYDDEGKFYEAKKID